MGKQIVLAKRPGIGEVKEDTFRLEEVDTPTADQLKDGEVLVRVLELGIEPAMRGWLNDARSYLPPVGINEVMRGSAIAKVEASRSTKFAKGDIVSTLAGWQEYAILEAKAVRKLKMSKGTRTGDFLGPLGTTGQTAWWGLHEVCKIKEGQVVVISGAAGAVGSIACQIARNRGCRVFGIAGSRDKCEWLKSLGCEAALNYKDSDFKAQYKQVPYADAIFDNVGGPILDMMLTRLAQGARIALCGAISGYNTPVPIKNYQTLIAQRGTLQGFIVFDYAKRYHEAEDVMSQWIAEGKLERREHRLYGLEKAPEALKGLFVGANTGKTIVELSKQEAKM